METALMKFLLEPGEEAILPFFISICRNAVFFDIESINYLFYVYFLLASSDVLGEKESIIFRQAWPEF